MKDKYFIDTNVFLYTFDSDPFKKEIALELIQEALSHQKGIVSYQVLQEFLNVVLKKFKVPMKIDDCKVYLETVLFPLCEVFPDQNLFMRALDLKKKFKFGFYDAVIVASALHGGCQILYSEDLQHRQKIEQLMIVNPFERNK